MSEVKKYTAALIGCGDIGFVFDAGKTPDVQGALTHFRAMNTSDKFNVIAAADKNKIVLEKINSEFGLPVFENHVDMLDKMKPEIVVVSTNDESHYTILNDLLDHKPLLVFCEKPLALGSDEIKIICKKYVDAKIPLQVNYTRRFLKEYVDIKNDLENGSIGKIESVTFYYSRGLIHNASHYIDLAIWYFGEPSEVKSFAVKNGISESDATVSFILRYNSGPEIIFTGLDIGKLAFAEFDIIGTEGRIKFNYKNEIERYTVAENPVFKGYSSYVLKNSIPVKSEQALPNAYENIYKTLTGSGNLKSAAENSLCIFGLINLIKEKNIWVN